ncbi:synaptic vesicle glycoprotein 2B [Striga asiatica]|uniref:Synaptic vesicle glycoprotein 2B n=1 Tax=Striga asiatica TaxID=4170 RepID=A0A5A7QIX8_STRAF|nr:synaptic vesicle glycoprotein 2B [Striga asiatica]
MVEERIREFVAMAPIMAKAGLHLRQLPFHTFSLFETPKLLSHFQYPSVFVPNHHHHHRQFLVLFSSWNLHICKCYKADEFNFGAEDDETEDFDDSLEQWFDVLEDYFDSIWIFKVFGSFGWTLPFILSSILLATGPKAFLMALALPIGQSTLAFAAQILLNLGKAKPNPKNKTNRQKSRAYSSRKGNFEPIAEWIDFKGPRKRKKRYQTPIAKNDVSVGSSNSGATEFGGWDELDAGAESIFGSSEKVGQESNVMRGGHEVKGKNGKLGKTSSGPLLLRLLVTIFPFFKFLD